MISVNENFREAAEKLYHQLTYEYESTSKVSAIALIESNLNLLFAKGYRTAVENQTEDLRKFVAELEKS